MDQLQAMRVFVRVAEAGSFSAVARELGRSQGAISKQIAALEAHLGVSLLLRTSRALTPTEEGRRYFADTCRLLLDIEASEAALKGAAPQLSGWVRVAASVGFGRVVLLPHVQSFLKLYPGLNIDLRLHDGYIDLVGRGIDVAIRIGQLPDSTLVARRLGWSQRALLVGQAYVDKVKHGIGLSRQPLDLATHNCIVYTERVDGHLWAFEHSAEGLGNQAVTARVQGNCKPTALKLCGCVGGDRDRLCTHLAF